MSTQRLPIVLAHGIARFDILLEKLRERFHLPETELGDRFHYFKGVKTLLESHGFLASSRIGGLGVVSRIGRT